MGSKGDKLTSAASTTAEDLRQRLDGLGEVATRKMFGGYGVFERDKMFALVDSSGVIFLKADDSNSERFQAAGAERHGRMPYYRLPETVLNDADALAEWAGASIAVAHGA